MLRLFLFFPISPPYVQRTTVYLMRHLQNLEQHFLAIIRLFVILNCNIENIANSEINKAYNSVYKMFPQFYSFKR